MTARWKPTGVKHTSEDFGFGPMLESAKRIYMLETTLLTAETAMRQARVALRQGKSEGEILLIRRPGVDAASTALDYRAPQEAEDGR